MPLSSSSLERLVPDALADNDATGKNTLALHLKRYEFAASHALPGRVLDIACGVGYGSRLIADRRQDIDQVVGVDISPEAISFASSHYAVATTRFVAADAMTFDDPTGFDTIVSLETIEHLSQPESFLRRVLLLLRRGGRFIGSVPTTPSTDVNPHHLHDFSERTFRAMGRELGLKEIEFFRQVQRFRPLQVLSRREIRLADMRENLIRYYLTHPRAAARRAISTAIDGFQNKYITIVWEKAA